MFLWLIFWLLQVFINCIGNYLLSVFDVQLCPVKLTYLSLIVTVRNIIHFFTAGYTPITFLYHLINYIIIPIVCVSGDDVFNVFVTSFIRPCVSLLYVL